MKAITRRAFFWVLGLLCPYFPVVQALARTKPDYLVLTEEQVQCINKLIQQELELNPMYVWGAASVDPGAPGDCSGKLYAIFFRCGIPVQRVTSSMMAEGLGGWRFPIVEWREGRSLAIVSMTMKPTRPNGHVGILVEDVIGDKFAMMAHESSSLGFVKIFVKRKADGKLDMGITQLRQTQK